MRERKKTKQIKEDLSGIWSGMKYFKKTFLFPFIQLLWLGVCTDMPISVRYVTAGQKGCKAL